MIQQNINQTLSLASLLATQNPSLQRIGEKNREIRDIERTIEDYKQGIESKVHSFAEALPDTVSKAESDAWVEVGKEFFTAGAPTSEDYFRLAQLKPSQENIKQYAEKKVAEQKAQSKAEAAAAKAEQGMIDKQNELRSARNYGGRVEYNPEYLKKINTSLNDTRDYIQNKGGK